jgi:hypothetical protein
MGRGAWCLRAGLLVSMVAAWTPGVAGAVSSTSLSATSVSGLSPLPGVAAADLARNVDTPVVVVLRDQHTDLPDTAGLAASRAGALAVDQRPILADLSLTHARGVTAYKLINAVAATVSTGEAARLAADPAVAEVVPDVVVKAGQRPPTVTASRSMRPSPAAGEVGQTVNPSGQQICAPRGQVQLNPEAIEAIRADSSNPNEPTAAQLGFTGRGVKVGWIADGIDIHNPDFTRNGKSIFFDYQDFSGDGTAAPTGGGEAFLDASSIAAQGNGVYNIGSSARPCLIRIEGVAPGATLAGLKAFPSSNQATTSSLVEAIDYAVTVDHVDVLNQSFGYNPYPDTTRDVVRLADDAAVAAGTTVVASTGDAGTSGTIGSPSTDPAILSAGASTTLRSYAQADVANYNGIHAQGWENNNVSSFSSGGVTQGVRVPDVLAPGDLNWAACSPSPTYGNCGGLPFELTGGTSESSPLTAGTAALVIEAYRHSHGGASPSPALIKELIVSTTQDLGHAGFEQGAGLVDAYHAVEAALSVPTSDGSPAPKGQTLLHTMSQLDAVAAAGTVEHFPVTLTNTGQGTQTVTMHGRILGDPHTVLSTTVNGNTKITFTVPVGASRLSVDVANPTASVTLLDPVKDLAVSSLIQGTSNFAHVDVRYPGFGTWTAFVSGTGATRVSATVATWQPFGAVSPASVTLAPGQSAKVNVSAPMPAVAGDMSAAVELDGPFGQVTSIPLTLRSLIPLTNGGGSFSTSVTGGNGRGGAPAETRYFQVDVPAGQKELGVTTHVPLRATDAYTTFLVAPDGQALAVASNQLPLPGGRTGPIEPGNQTHVLDPAAGRWTIIVAVTEPVGGTVISANLTGTVSLAPVTVAATGVPNSTSVRLQAGHRYTAHLSVQNNGPSPEAYFVDGRGIDVQTVQLAPFTNAANLTLPLSNSVPTPQWIVPTDTSAITAAAEATAPVTFDFAPYLGTVGGEVGGDPDLGAITAGNTAQGHWSAPAVTPGDWFVDPALIGPFGPPRAPTATANAAMMARTRAFDPAITSATGDVWLRSIDPSATATPVIVAVGATATISVVITPSAPSGTVVSGDLFVDDTTVISPFGTPVGPTGTQIAAIPYRYTVS